MSDPVRIALLRGINVGGHNRLGMAELCALLADLGYSDVRTHLNSGNVVFACPSPDPAAEIGEAIAAHLGLQVRVLVRSAQELAEVVAANPLAGVATDPSRHFVAFFSRQPEVAPLEVPAPDRLVLRGREGYLWCPNGARGTVLTNAFLEKRLGVVATSRNWNTVTRLLSLAGPDGSIVGARQGM